MSIEMHSHHQGCMIRYGCKREGSEVGVEASCGPR